MSSLSRLSATARTVVMVLAVIGLTSQVARAGELCCHPACTRGSLCSSDTADGRAVSWPLQDGCCIDDAGDCDSEEGGYPLVSAPDSHATRPSWDLSLPGSPPPSPAPETGQAPRLPARIYIWNSSFLC